MPFEELIALVPPMYKDEIYKFIILDVEWVSHCLRENKIVDPNQYCLKWEEIHGTSHLTKSEIKQEAKSSIKKECRQSKLEVHTQHHNSQELNEKIEVQEKQEANHTPIVFLKKVWDNNGWEDEEVKKGEDLNPEGAISDPNKPPLTQQEFTVIKKREKIRNNKLIMEAYRYLYDYTYDPEPLSIEPKDHQEELQSNRGEHEDY